MTFIILLNIIGQTLVNLDLDDEFVNYIVIPIDHILTILGVIG